MQVRHKCLVLEAASPEIRTHVDRSTVVPIRDRRDSFHSRLELRFAMFSRTWLKLKVLFETLFVEIICLTPKLMRTSYMFVNQCVML
jgi:hypothetical protein